MIWLTEENIELIRFCRYQCLEKAVVMAPLLKLLARALCLFIYFAFLGPDFQELWCTMMSTFLITEFSSNETMLVPDWVNRLSARSGLGCQLSGYIHSKRV